MSVADDRLEILMGKLLDGEISPAEQRLLERELEQDAQARELLGQLQALQECCREVVGQGVLEGGADPRAVFERAWRRNTRSLWGRVGRTLPGPFGGMRFAVGLAAGFLVGLSLHFVLFGRSEPPIKTPSESLLARSVSPGINDRDAAAPGIETSVPWDVTRKVDWYGFTDATGNQWLIEGIREGMVRPAAYHGDL